MAFLSCLAETKFIVSFDIRTGDSEMFVLSGYRPEILNLEIGKPGIHGPAADVKGTCGLEKASIGTFGSLPKYTLVTSMAGMPAIPGMVRYIDDNLATERRKKK